VIALLSVLPDRGGNSGTQTSEITWDSYNVTLDVRDDGSVHVTEYQEIDFDGTYSVGFVEIPMERIESIDNVRVTVEEGVPVDDDDPPYSLVDEEEGALVEAEQVAWDAFRDEPGTFRARQEGELFLIDYAFDPTSRYVFLSDYSNNTRTVIVEYDVEGVIRDYPDAAEPWQQVHWMAISSDVTAIAPVRSATVTVNLPETVPGEDLVVAPEPTTNDGQTIVWARNTLREGDEFDVQAAFPTITDATAPSWQETADARDTAIEEQERRQNAGQLMLILAGVAVLVIGSLVILYAWYRGVREPSIGLVHQEIADPPGELPAVLVGSLLDEQVNPRDIAAGVLDLDRQGLITIRPRRDGESENYYLTLERNIPYRPAWTRVMLTDIFGENAPKGTTKGFSALGDLFGVRRYELQQAIDETLVEDGYYEEMPEASRKHWTWVTYGFPIVGVLAAVAILAWVGGWTGWAIVPLVPGIALWWFGRRLTPHVAQKTRLGAETAALWRAFERHLSTTQYMISKDTAARREAEFGPWLTAFGLQSAWLSEMNRPSWDVSRIPPQEGTGSSTWVWGNPGGNDAESVDDTRRAGSSRGRGRTTLQPPAWRPIGGGWNAGSWRDMQSTSNRMASSLSSMSDSAFSMIGDMLEAIGSSSGGSGGSSGRSSSRGSSSRSGGGRSRSSSGGGRRGFR
jgi:uncharacterized membrane protein YgcG